MSNCIDDQNNPDNELDKLKTWTDKQIKFEAKRGRKGRYEVARKKGRLTGVDFMRDRFGLSDVYPERDMEKIWKKAKIMARLYGYSDKELPRKISRADFDLWWLEGRESARTNPLIRKGTLVGDTQLYRQSKESTSDFMKRTGNLPPLQHTEHYFSHLDYNIIVTALEYFKKNKDKNQIRAYNKESIKRLDDLIAYFHIHQKLQAEKQYGR